MLNEADDEFKEVGKRREGEDNVEREKDNEMRKKGNDLDLEGFWVSV